METLIASPAHRVEGRGEIVKAAVSTMNWNVSCAPQDQRSVYIGESARNLYTRSKEHLNTYRNNPANSFMAKHQGAEHSGEEPSYKARVTACTRDCLSRQVREQSL